MRPALPCLPKPDKSSARRENHRSMFVMHVEAKVLNKNTSQLNSTAYGKDYTPRPNAICFWNTRMMQYIKIKHTIHHINRMKEEKHRVISIDKEKEFNKM